LDKSSSGTALDCCVSATSFVSSLLLPEVDDGDVCVVCDVCDVGDLRDLVVRGERLVRGERVVRGERGDFKDRRILCFVDSVLRAELGEFNLGGRLRYGVFFLFLFEVVEVALLVLLLLLLLLLLLVLVLLLLLLLLLLVALRVLPEPT
jgi:hypothetical protein